MQRAVEAEAGLTDRTFKRNQDYKVTGIGVGS
jgi:hypothetical protein